MHSIRHSFLRRTRRTCLCRIGDLAFLCSSSPHGPSIPAFGAATSLRWSGMDLSALQ